MITKKFIMSFQPYDYEGIEKMLSEKSAEGWQLVKAREFSWTFKQGEINEFQYNVTYIPSASEYRAEDTEHQVTLDEYCANAGWERVCNYRKIQIYRNRDPLAVPIDTDEAQKLQMVHLAVKKWLLFPTWLFILFFTLLFVSAIVTFFNKKDPITFDVAKIFLYLIVILVSKGIDIANYYVWYFKSKKSIENNGKCCSTKWADRIQFINMFLFCVFVLWDSIFIEIKTMEDLSEVILVIGIVIFYKLHAAWIKKLCRYIGWPTFVNRIFTILGALILSIFCSALVVAMLMVRGFLPL